MSHKAKQIILYTTLIIIGTFFLVKGLVKAQGFFIPIVIAGLLAMVLLPVLDKLTSWKVPKGLAVLMSDLLLLGVCVGFFFIVGEQTERIIENWPTYWDKLQPKIEQVQQFVEKKTGVTPQQQTEELKNVMEGGSGAAVATNQISSFVPKFTSFTGNFLLVFVYVFFFLYYRKKFKLAVLNFLPDQKRDKGTHIIDNFSKISQQYLFGRFILILFLAFIYSVGLLIIGIKHAIFVSVIAAFLTIIPYVGNIIGVVLALFMSALTGGSLGEMIGIVAVFSVAQFFESYILEPYIVGHKVEINPIATIIGVVVGGMIWGLAGMIIAIPVMGIFKAIFDNIDVLNPMGYVLDESDMTSGGNSWMFKFKNKVVGLFKKN